MDEIGDNLAAGDGCLIGLVGYAQSGKDSAADALEERGYTRLAFADGVREALYALNPYVPIPRHIQEDWKLWTHMGNTTMHELVEAVGWDRAKTVPEVRRLLQFMGTEAGRDIHGADCWVNRAMAKAPKGGRVVFTDVRFPNEADAIKRRGGYLVRISRPGYGPANGHQSETNIDGIECDMLWHNDATLEDWRQVALHGANQLEARRKKDGRGGYPVGFGILVDKLLSATAKDRAERTEAAG